MSVNILHYPNRKNLHAGTLQLTALASGNILTAPIITNSNVLCQNMYVARAVVADSSSGGNITGNTTLTGWLDISGNISVGGDALINGNLQVDGWINSSSNISAGTSLSSVTTITAGTDLIVTENGSFGGNVEVAGWLDVTANISSGSHIAAVGNVSGNILVSNVAIGTPPLFVTSTTQVDNLRSEFSGTSDTTLALESATTTVNVSAATAPTAGQVLQASSSTAASWVTLAPSGGATLVLAGNITGDTLASAGGSTSLSLSSNVLQVVTGSLDHTLVLPNSTRLGTMFVVANRSTGNLTLSNIAGTQVDLFNTIGSGTYLCAGTANVVSDWIKTSSGGA